MYEHAAVWTIEGPDGTTVTFNGGGPLLLEEVTGFDSPAVRTNLEDLPEDDGAGVGDFFYGSRPVTMRGRVAASSAADRNTTVVNLQRALRALRGDLTLKSQASGLPAMQAKARVESLRVGRGYVKEFLIGLVCPDPRIYSQTLNDETAQGTATVQGAAFPWTFPVEWGGGTGATLSVSCTNAGNFDAPPKLKVVGPVTSPQFKNATTGDSLYVDGIELAAGQWVEVDVAARTAVRDDGTSVYDRIRFPDSVWWLLEPGANTVELWATGTDGTTVLEVAWRDVWA